MIKTISDIIRIKEKFVVDNKKQLFFRGHDNVGYKLVPTVMRSTSYKNNYKILYQEISTYLPHEIPDHLTPFERIVKLQHHGFPTYLLDITCNILVATYFACVDNFDYDGELLFFTVEKNELYRFNSKHVNNMVKKSLGLEVDRDITDNKSILCVIPKYIDTRVKNQAGAFLLYGTNADTDSPFHEELDKNIDTLQRIIKNAPPNAKCPNEHEQILQYKNTPNTKLVIERYTIPKETKKTILSQLDELSINRYTLFDTLDHATSYFKSKII